MKSEDKSQLNIKIDPDLLLKIKSEAIKEGKTLSAFVIEKLSNIESTSPNYLLEERLIRIEKHLNLDQNPTNQKKDIGKIFTDEGAKNYGKTAKRLFELYLNKKGVSIEDGLQELAKHLVKLPHSSPELVFQILLGNHDLTGLEMTMAYRRGSCAMRTALSEWSNDDLEALNEAFLNAVITRSLV